MLRNEVIEFKREIAYLPRAIRSLDSRIQQRQGNLCRYEGAKLEKKKGELLNLQNLKAEKPQNLRQLKNRIPTLWDV